MKPWETDALPRAAKSADGLFADLLPRVSDARQAQARFEQRVALLRHVEALRLYAAGHDGKFPNKPGDIGVPLPADPFTGKPFGYTLDGAAVRLLAGGEPAVSYEVVIGK